MAIWGARAPRITPSDHPSDLIDQGLDFQQGVDLRAIVGGGVDGIENLAQVGVCHARDADLRKVLGGDGQVVGPSLAHDSYAGAAKGVNFADGVHFIFAARADDVREQFCRDTGSDANHPLRIKVARTAYLVIVQ